MRNRIEHQRWFLKIAVWMIPVPFLACEFGWLVAELGRQPWTVYGVLPTWMSASTHSVGYMIFSLIGFVALYTAFIVAEMYLMVRAIRRGPEDADTGSPGDDVSLDDSIAGRPAGRLRGGLDRWKLYAVFNSSGGCCSACC